MALESFGQCLQRILQEEGMSASSVARLVGFRSRNSLFRILNDETSVDVDKRFLNTLKEQVGDAWRQANWQRLESALDIKRVGLQQHLSNHAFCQGVGLLESNQEFQVEMNVGGSVQVRPLKALLQEISREGEISVVICGCCFRPLLACLDACLVDAGAHGRLYVRHYIDVSEQTMVGNILGALPMLSRVWYNARLVDADHCPPKMMAFYRLNAISLTVKDAAGEFRYHQLIQCDEDRFVYTSSPGQQSVLVDVLDRHRFQLDLLKPRTGTSEGVQAFVDYTGQYAALERDCMILSIKPDIHFNLVPCEILYPAIMEGFGQSGMTGGEELLALMEHLRRIHQGRVDNMRTKRQPTQIVYSLQAMEQFMRTGVQSDHFFIQRAYTLEERRAIVRFLLQQMRENPCFNIYFHNPKLPDIRTEMTMYEGKGVLLMDAYTSYDLHDDHSEAIITLPGFLGSFRAFFMDVMLERLTLSRQESMAKLEALLQLEP